MTLVSNEKNDQTCDKLGLIFLKAVSAGLKRKIIEDPLLTEQEWRALMDLSSKHALLPVVFESVYPLLPVELEHEYRIATISLISNQARKTDLFLRVYQEFQKKNIEPLVIKGIVCREAYDLSDWRVSADEDLYIPRSEFPHFHDLMGQIGFQSSSPNYRSEHETVYTGEGIIIEGHWELFPQESQYLNQMNILVTDIMHRARYMDIDGVKILTPEPTDHLIYLILHALKHFSSAGVGIRQICDIAMYSKKYEVDWNRVKETTSCFGATYFTEAIIDAANRYFDMSVPDGWSVVDSTNLIKDSLAGGTFGHSSADRLHSAYITTESEEKTSRLASILRAAFPNRKVMEINYHWVSKSRLLLPVGWLVRLVRYAGIVTKTGESPLHSIEIGRSRIKLLKEYGILKARKKANHIDKNSSYR